VLEGSTLLGDELEAGAELPDEELPDGENAEPEDEGEGKEE